MKITTQDEFNNLPPGHYTISRELVTTLLTLHWRKAMHIRQLHKVVNLYHDGVSSEVCLAIIMDLTKDLSPLARASWIHKFYEEVINKENKE